MAPDPGALLEAYLQAGDRRDDAQLTSCSSEDVVTHAPGGTPTVGVAAQIASWTAADEGIRDLAHEVRSLFVHGGTAAAARILVTGTHTGPLLGIAATGAALRVDGALFVRVESGRIAEVWVVVDTAMALQQLGLLTGQSLSPGT